MNFPSTIQKYSLHRILVSVSLFFSAGVLSIWVGSSGYSVFDLSIFSNSESSAVAKTILIDIRLPRILLAALCGAALSVAGVLSQGLFRNPLASPTILGTTSGGTLAAAFVFYLGNANFHWLSVPAAAFVGSILATIFILHLSVKNQNWPIENLLLAGFALNAILGACTSLLISIVLEDYQKSTAIVQWMLGGFNARGWEHVKISILPVFIGLWIALKLSKKLNILILGEKVASTLSLDITKFKIHAIVSISMLVGITVSVAGALPFIGLVVPHFTRKWIGPENRKLMIHSAVNGATLTVLADLIARTVRSPMEIEVGILTSLIGAPLFLWALMKGMK